MSRNITGEKNRENGYAHGAGKNIQDRTGSRKKYIKYEISTTDR